MDQRRSLWIAYMQRRSAQQWAALYNPQRPSWPLDFPHFLSLPIEARLRVYADVLTSDRPIRPMLCDRAKKGVVKFCNKNMVPRFHDDIHRLMALTRVSRQVHDESLPIFYIVNLFYFDTDMLTYVDRLTHLNRFHYLQRIIIPAPCHPKDFAARCVQDILTTTSGIATYEGWAQASTNAGTFSWLTAPPSAYKEHPHYNIGGFRWISIFLLLRKLSCRVYPAGVIPPGSYFSFNTAATKRLVGLRVPSMDIFHRRGAAQHFLTVISALNLDVRCVSDPHLRWDEREKAYLLCWDRRLQEGRREPGLTWLDEKEEREARRKVGKLFRGDAERDGAGQREWYLRVSCRTGVRTRFVWEEGGVLVEEDV